MPSPMAPEVPEPRTPEVAEEVVEDVMTKSTRAACSLEAGARVGSGLCGATRVGRQRRRPAGASRG